MRMLQSVAIHLNIYLTSQLFRIEYTTYKQAVDLSLYWAQDVCDIMQC